MKRSDSVCGQVQSHYQSSPSHAPEGPIRSDFTHLLLGLVDLPALARRTRPSVALAASTDLHPPEGAIVAAERPRADVVSPVLIAVLFVDAGEVLERVGGGRGRDGAATGAGEGAELGGVLERVNSAAAGTLCRVAHRRPARSCVGVEYGRTQATPRDDWRGTGESGSASRTC
jgi:hypothetical protein